MRYINFVVIALALGFATPAKAAVVQPREQADSNLSGFTAIGCLAQSQVLATPDHAPPTDFQDKPAQKRAGILENVIAKNAAIDIVPALLTSDFQQNQTLPASLIGIEPLEIVPAAAEIPTPIPAPAIVPAGLVLLTALATLRKLRLA